MLNERLEGWRGLPWAIVFVAAPTLAKVALDTTLADVPPFLTYFPAVTICAVVMGPRWGLAVLAAAAVIAEFLFLGPAAEWEASTNDLIMLALFVAGGLFIIGTANAMRQAVRELKSSGARVEALNAELQHRVQNNLAIVQAIAQQTIRSTPESPLFYEAFAGRLGAISRAHRMLSKAEWSECPLPQFVESALKPFGDTDVVKLEGPPSILPAISCVPLALALHELGTNAAKYGALSERSGSVKVTWRIDPRGLVLRWEEAGGPAVAHPKRKGMGSRLLKPQPGLDGVTLDFQPSGLVCTIVIHDMKPL